MLHPLANAVAVASEVVALLLHLLQFFLTGGYEFQHLGITWGEGLVVTLVAVEHLEDAGEPLIKEEAPGEDLTQIDKSLEPVKGLGFVTQKLSERKKPGFGTKIRNWLSYYTGKTLGKIGGFFATLGKGIADLFKKGPGTFGGIRNGMRGSSRFKNKENPNAIPGWNGALQRESRALAAL